MATLIGPEDYFPLLTIMLGLVWFGFWSERNRFACKVPGVVWILVLAVILSNTQIIPIASPLYNFIFGYILPLAVPLLLFKATFGKIFRESGMILPIFLIGSVMVCVGTLLAVLLVDLGPLEPKIAATYAAAWIGGMVNLAAVAEMTALTSEEFTVAVSASAPVSIIGLSILVVLPTLPIIRRHFPSKIMEEQGDAAEKPSMQAEDIPFNLPHIAGALVLSAIICTVGSILTDYLGIGNYRLFVVTIITVVLANILTKPLTAIKGDFELGMFAMYLFFAAIGATTDAVTFVTQAPLYFIFGLIIIVTHIALILLCAKIFKFDLAETIIGSGANIVGAAPAAGIASSKGWKTLVTPAIATGMLGYAIANFFGLALYKLLG